MKNQLTKTNNKLPTKIEDLAKFVLIGREKLISVRAEIRAMDKLDLAKEVRDQKKEEAQYLAEMLIDAETKIGEITKSIPKGNKHQKDGDVLLKKDQLKQLGITEKDKQRFEMLSDNPEIVEKAKQEALERNEVINRTLIENVIKKDRQQKRIENNTKKIEEASNLEVDASIKILNGDVMEMLATIEDNSIDCLCTDPPYFILKDQEWDQFKDMNSYLTFINDWLDLVTKKIKPTGRMYISFATDFKFDIYEIFRKNNFFGFKFGNEIIWSIKNNVVMFDKKRYRITYEPVFYLYGPEAGNLNFTEYESNYQSSVWDIAVPQSNFSEGKYHPCQKPLELYRRIISSGTKKGELVLDCFAGSGTTGVICKELERSGILIEKEEKYIKLIKGRINSVV